MDNRKQQPFYVGQRVVCIDNKARFYSKYSPSELLKSNKVYLVISIRKVCCSWEIDIGVRIPLEYGYTLCGKCGAKEYDCDPVYWFLASRFAPYDPPAIEIPAELLEVDVKDGIDAPAVLTPDLLTPQPNP